MEAGIEPEGLLFSRLKLIKDFMLLASFGIGSESKLQNKCTNVHFVRFPKVEGIGPVRHIMLFGRDWTKFKQIQTILSFDEL